MIKPKVLASTAYHEAGHAFAAYIMEIDLKEVSIIEDDTKKGYCLHSNPLEGVDLEFDHLTPEDTDRMERIVMTSLAGPCAQKKYNKWRVRKIHSASDYKEAIELINRFTGGPKVTEAYLNYLLVKTELLLENPVYWGSVTRIAEELIKKKTLSAADIEKLYPPPGVKPLREVFPSK